jgi:peptidoglycan/xylan/chitin deacetylase (PgdA/CDA1 family)
MALTLSAIFVALLFEGWTIHEVDAAKSRVPCTTPAPQAVGESGPVLRRINGDHVASSAVPARTVALTFDGGPDPYWTPRLLDLLRRHHAHATFFLFGAQAARHPQLVRRILAEGNEIGSNTYTGADLGSSSRVRTAMELTLTQKTLAGTAGIRTDLLRMPLTTQVDTLCGAEWTADGAPPPTVMRWSPRTGPSAIRHTAWSASSARRTWRTRRRTTCSATNTSAGSPPSPTHSACPRPTRGSPPPNSGRARR